MKLCLGTAQLGSNYGIQVNTQPSLTESIIILEKAVFDYNISMLDTAIAYGDAEQILGKFNTKNPNCKKTVSVISKLHPDALINIDESRYSSIILNQVKNSLNRLNLEHLDGFLLHKATDIFQNKVIEALSMLKGIDLVKNIGVSIYEPEEAIAAAHNELIDYIQVPYSVLDQRLERIDFFRIAKENSKTIFTRSAFLQGLLLMNRMPSGLEHAAHYIELFHKLCELYGLSYSDACINYILANEYIDYIVVGVDNLQELHSNNNAMKKKPNQDFVCECKAAFSNVERDIVNPNLWKRG